MKHIQAGSPLAVIHEYWRHAWRYKFLTIGTLVSIPLSVVTLVFLPQLFIADILQRISNSQFTPGDLWGSFGTPLMWYIAISLFGGVIMWRIAVLFIWSLEMRVVRDIYQRMFAHLTKQSMTFHANHFGGSMVSQANKFAGSYIRVADTALFDIYTLTISFVATLVILFPRAPLAAFLLLVTSIIFIGVAIVFTKKIRELRAQEAAKENKQTGFIADAVTNILTVKSFAAEAYENKRFGKATEELRGATFKVMKASLIREAIFGFTTLTVSIVALVGGLMAVVYFSADVATVYLIIVLTAQITQRLWEFSQNTLKNLNKAFGDAESMSKILATKPTIQDPKNPEISYIKDGDVVFDAVTFTHEGSKDATFHKLSLAIRSGEKIGLVGASGSGKTTFTRLLLRFSDIDGGAIRIDGHDISNMTQHNLHSAISYVPQEPLLFHRSIKENIAYDQDNASQNDIEKAAEMAHAHEFITNLPDGYNTLVGERGVKLSGGQRQRIAIARAMLKKAPILLLDEATSALDSESEVLIQDALWKLMDKKTAILIAHRLSTIQKMDRIIVLENGKIAEQGSHKDLLHKGGTYARLWAHQSGGFLEE